VLGFQENLLTSPSPSTFRSRLAGCRGRRAPIEADRGQCALALKNKRRRDLPLFACVQGWDAESYSRCAENYVDQGFEGIAIGGLVPRVSDVELVTTVVKSIRALSPALTPPRLRTRQPSLVRHLFDLGVDSVDSSSYVKLAADGHTWDRKSASLTCPPWIRMHLALANLRDGLATRTAARVAQIRYASQHDPAT